LLYRIRKVSTLVQDRGQLARFKRTESSSRGLNGRQPAPAGSN
jgi:hypothetical protein